jgi:hypothetical protein
MCQVSVSAASTTPPQKSKTPQSPVVSLIANPPSIPSGGTSLLSLTSVNATTCTITDPKGIQIGTHATNSTVASPVLTATTIFTATCMDATGVKAVTTTTVTVQ